jgi:hypothetical protein
LALEEINRDITVDLQGEELAKVKEEALAQMLVQMKGKEVEISKLAEELSALAVKDAKVMTQVPPGMPPGIQPGMLIPGVSNFFVDQETARERQRIRDFAREMRRLKEEDPEGYEIAKDLENLEQQSRKLGNEIQKMKEKDPERKVKLKELQGVLGQAFEVGEKRREREAQAVEQELNKIRELMAKRRDNREMIIEYRLSELTGQNEVIIW